MPVSPLALSPERGGPKNLPIVKSYLNDIEDETQTALSTKPHLVIIGGGWGVRALLKTYGLSLTTIARLRL